MIKKILLVLILIAVIAGAFTYLYITDKFNIRHIVASQIAKIPFISQKLGLDEKYRIEELNVTGEKNKVEKYEMDETEENIKDKIIPPKDRYFASFMPATGSSGNKEDKKSGQFQYPSPGKKDYSPEDLDKLAEIYTSMEPDQAVPILEQFEDRIIIDIFSRMKTKKVAEIMGAFDPKRASVISLKMLENSEKSQ